MDISLNNMNAQELSQYIETFNRAYEAEGVKANYAVSASGNVTITVAGPNGSIEIPIDVPALDEADAPGDDVPALGALLAKMTNASADLSGDLPPIDPKTVLALSCRSTFCDLYQVMALLVKTSLEQRMSAAAVRRQTHAAIQASLVDQAHNTLAAAHTAFVLGIVNASISTAMLTVQIVCSGVAAVKSAKNSDLAAANKAHAETGQAQKEVKNQDALVTKTNANTTLPGGSGAARIDARAAKVSAQTQRLIDKATQKHVAVEEAQLAKDNAAQKLAETPETEVMETRQDLDVAAEKARVERAKDAGAAYETLNEEVKLAEGKVKAAEADLKAAKKELSALGKDATPEARDAAQAKVHAAEQGLSDAKADLKTVKDFRDQTCYEMREGLGDYLNNKVSSCREYAHEMMSRFSNSPEAKKIQRLTMAAQTVPQLSSAVGQFMTTVSEKVTKTVEAENKLIDAGMEGLQAMKENAQEMHDEAGELFKAVLALLKEIIQVENESMRMAIQA